MITDVLDIPRPVVRSRRKAAVMLSTAGLVALVFVAGVAVP